MGPVFGLVLGSVLCPKWYPKLSETWPKIGPTMVQKSVISGISFFGGLGALQVTLGSLLGLPKALLGGLWTPKTLKNLMMSWRFLGRHLFAALELWMALRKPSWHARSRFGTQNAFQKGPKSGPIIV